MIGIFLSFVLSSFTNEKPFEKPSCQCAAPFFLHDDHADFGFHFGEHFGGARHSHGEHHCGWCTGALCRGGNH